MAMYKLHTLAFVVLIFYIPVAQSWGIDGHLIICRLAQPRLSKAAEDAVSKLLPAYAENDLGSMCSWADRVKFRYHWSSPLHYLNTPDNLCTLSKPNHFCPCYVVVLIIFARLLKLGRLYGLTKQRHGRPAAKHLALFRRRYASEGIKAACDWAYKGVHEDSVLEDDYFLSRKPVINLRLAQGGVRLAATLNRIFG